MINATYFDGQSSRRQPVELLLHKGIVAIGGAGLRRTVRLSQIDVSEPLARAPRILRLPDGGVLEVADPALARLLRKNGYREPRVVKWQRNWPMSLLSLVSLLAVLIAGYQWGLPWAADRIAQRLPASLERQIGERGLQMIDAAYMEASRMDEAQQQRLRRLFAGLRQPHGERTAYRIEFRYSKVGPNAFALPNGVIVMTDQLVALAQDDAAVLAVLAHELGHVQRRHALRGLLQALGVGALLNLAVGDVYSALAAVPAFLLDQKYSRDFEREADRYAIDMMQANGLQLAPMARLFEKMGAASRRPATEEEQPLDDDVAVQPPHERRNPRGERHAHRFDYLSSHPSDAERIARLKAADERR